MTFVSLKLENFFEQFDTTHIVPNVLDIEEYQIAYSSDGIALEKPSSSLGRVWRGFWGTSFNSSDSAKQIVECARSCFALVSAPSPTTPKERIITTCRSASRTCFFIDRIIQRALVLNNQDDQLKALHTDLNVLGKGFLTHESLMLEQHPISVACQNGTLPAALDLIREGGPIHKAIGHYTDLLALAFEQKLYKLSRQFIQLGADPVAAFRGKVKERATTLLFHAIKSGQEKVAIVLVEAGAALDLVNDDGKSPLHMAASAGFIRLAEEMILRGANVAAVDNRLNTPLHDACRAFKADMALLLVQKGADVAQVNRQIDEDSKKITPGTCAFSIPGLINGEENRALEFYCKTLESYNPRSILQQGGIKAFLEHCRAHPDKLIRGLSGPNPLEIALLFQDPQLAVKVVEKIPLSRFFEYLKKLKRKYPLSRFDAIEFCYLTQKNSHLEKKLRHLETYAPTRDVSLDELLTYVTGPLKVYGKQLSAKEITPLVRSFIARIQGKSDMPALMGSAEEKNRFYELLEQRCLKNIIITFQDLPDNKELQDKKAAFLRELIDLEQGENCAGRYYGVITKLFRTFCASSIRTFEEEIYILLAEHREILLEQCLDPMKGNNRNDYNHLLRMLGEKLSIPGFDTCQYYHDLVGDFDLTIAEEEFYKRYTVASIINDLIGPALEHNKDLRDKFCEWMLQKMPSDWGDTLRQNLQHMQAKSTTSSEHIREYLRKNGVSIDDQSTDYEQALNTARRKAYLEREVFENGTIKPVAISRMLAGLEKPVVSSNKLQHEPSPTTFACDWMLDIIDMVNN